jgi:nicotinate-nucleotide adenylyltransferase
MGPPAESGDVPRRIGVFGGTFDPPHLGHLSAARDVAAALDLHEVLWIPARRSPHKDDTPGSSGEIRLRMVAAAIEEDPLFTASDLELRRPEPSYTVDTLRQLSHSAGDLKPDLFLIMGVDQFRRFGEWRAPDEISRLATLVVMDREGASLASLDGAAPHGELRRIRVPVRRVDVSSTGVRAAVEEGRAFDHLVPPGVVSIIRSEGLYRH